MGTHTVRMDCVKCKAQDSFVYSFESKNPAIGEAFCLNCGRYYGTVDKRLTKKELAELRKEYVWSD